ncbi:MAG: hypothetical protein ACI4V7_10655 [Succinivibrionaceae bacterium]
MEVYLKHYKYLFDSNILTVDAYIVDSFIKVIQLLKDNKNQVDFIKIYNETFFLFVNEQKFHEESLNVSFYFRDWNFAIEIAKNYRDAFPQNINGYTKGCHALCASQKYAEAEQLGLEMYHKWPNDRNVLVRFIQNAIDNADWLVAYERSKDLREKIPNEWYGWAIGCASLKEARYIEESLELTKQMLERFPQDFNCLIEACKVYTVARRYENLLHISSKLINLRKDNIWGWLYKSQALSNLGFSVEADVVAKESISLFKDNISCWYRYVTNVYESCNWLAVYERTSKALDIYPNELGFYLKQFESLCKLSVINAKNEEHNYAELLKNCLENLLLIAEKTPQFANIFNAVNVIATQNNITDYIIDNVDKYASKKNKNEIKFFLQSENGENSTISSCAFINDINNYLLSKGVKTYVYMFCPVDQFLRKHMSDITYLSKKYKKYNYAKKYEADYFSQLFDKNVSMEYLKAVCNPPKIYKNTEDYDVFENFTSKYVNTIHGNRVTVGQQKNPKNDIYIYGSCITYGLFSDDECTIESYLQNLINCRGYSYSVHNRGLPGIDINSIHKSIINTEFKKGDIVTIIVPKMIKMLDVYRSFLFAKNIPFFELKYYFSEHYSYYDHIFADSGSHLTKQGNKLIAQKLFEDVVLGNTKFLDVVDEYTKKYISKNNDDLSSMQLAINDEYYEQIQKLFENVPKFAGG